MSNSIFSWAYFFPSPFIIFAQTKFFLHFFSVANGIYQNTVYGIAAKLPFKYTGAVVLGSVSFIFFQQLKLSKLKVLNPKWQNCNNFCCSHSDVLWYFSESEWYHSCHHQHHHRLDLSEPSNRRHLLLHHGLIHSVGLLRHILCFTVKCKILFFW